MVVFEMLIARGARHSARNDGGDTPLHLAAAHGNKDIVVKVNLFVLQIISSLNFKCYYTFGKCLIHLFLFRYPMYNTLIVYG